MPDDGRREKKKPPNKNNVGHGTTAEGIEDKKNITVRYRRGRRGSGAMVAIRSGTEYAVHAARAAMRTAFRVRESERCGATWVNVGKRDKSHVPLARIQKAAAGPQRTCPIGYHRRIPLSYDNCGYHEHAAAAIADGAGGGGSTGVKVEQ